MRTKQLVHINQLVQNFQDAHSDAVFSVAVTPPNCNFSKQGLKEQHNTQYAEKAMQLLTQTVNNQGDSSQQ